MKNSKSELASNAFTKFLETKYTRQEIEKLVDNSKKKILAMLSEAKEAAIDKLRGYALAQAKSQVQTTFTTPNGLHLDLWQYQALQALLEGKHVIIDAPTSAGKTRVIEALLEYQLPQGAQLIYTSPVKSLSNDKYFEFIEKYGKENIGINTGDFKENLYAPIVLATLETYRNALLGIEPDISRKIVVFDEYHYLQDESRGSAWEEALILTPAASQLILLSASVPNCEDFANWITNLSNKETEVIRVQKRPVPLLDLVCTDYGWILCEFFRFSAKEKEKLLEINVELRKKRPRFRDRHAFNIHIKPLISALELNLGPIIVYASRRADVEALALAFYRHCAKSTKQITNIKISERIKNLSGWSYVSAELQKLVLLYGIAYHHSGLIPPARIAIETLLKEGLLRICFGTMGISLGVNFAVRSTYIADDSRPSENGEIHYSNSEIMQMLGRAGRRGHDSYGFSLWPTLGQYIFQLPHAREKCQSSLKFDPSTILGILGQHQDVSYLFKFYQKSFFMLHKNITNKYQMSSIAPVKKIMKHLEKLGALINSQLSTIGDIARYFPQSGGLIIANFLATKQINASNFSHYLQVMAIFCSAHFKDIRNVHADINFLQGLKIESLIDSYYPHSIFPELYDRVKVRRHNEPPITQPVFREFNMGTASIVKQWLNPQTKWEALVADHSSKYFSDGDCMNVLFRFATFLQSCARLSSIEPDIAAQAKKLWKVLMREPLDARNRMLIEEADTKL